MFVIFILEIMVAKGEHFGFDLDRKTTWTCVIDWMRHRNTNAGGSFAEVVDLLSVRFEKKRLFVTVKMSSLALPFETLRKRGHVCPSAHESGLHGFLQIFAYRSSGLSCRPLVCWWTTRRFMRDNPLSFKGRFSMCWKTQVSRFERCHGVPVEPAHFTSGHADHDAKLHSPGPLLFTIHGAVDCAAAIQRTRATGSWCL